MYGENLGTGTLAKSLVRLAQGIYEDIDDGATDEETVEDARNLMEGAFVLMGELWWWEHDTCPCCGKEGR